MRILDHFSPLIIFFSVLDLYLRSLQIFLEFLVMDSAWLMEFMCRKSDRFGFGFGAFECLRQACNVLCLLFVFGFGLKMLRHGSHCEGLIRLLCGLNRKSDDARKGIRCDPNLLLLHFKRNFLRPLKDSNLVSMDKLGESKEAGSISSELKADSVLEEDADVDEYEGYDVMALRKMIETERRRANAACLELEEERMASASAAEEAMTMILRLQHEKSSVQLEAQQFRRMAEQKQHHDQEVIQFLSEIVMGYESKIKLLEDQLKLCLQKLQHYVKSDEGDVSEEVDLDFINSTVEFDLDSDMLISSLEHGLGAVVSS
ncbi:uncharacterized protein LOC131164719 [Malania oleifera]|uniref:uncharacterized protein LOC131164719 n=1 Tax=Malania oleifera TaxID=397392 RepID=UPI0025ADFCB7|nr:uncharacterized protein LOC131164719 [Malania oleifera]